MSTEQHGEVHHHRKRNTALRVENMIQLLMVIAAAILAVGLIYGVVSTGSTAPAWMR
ncbi:MAG TPA: hypothetical protein VLI41_01820 [Phenylobacterium sp.]|uniref:hypothetical protein n=1 Tax=Phenylobacterium sp. TaxID=1871053 RepID=UPI002C6623BA|nr:hypothetical protein [Phenylobacterium sp.]HSV01917.1 hypothetical protein [Phenylobacterium sp.]